MATLHMLCGKIAAGKSTLAAELARQPNTVLIGEDFWMTELYPGEVLTLEDYTKYSARLHKRNAAGTHEYAVTDAEFDQFMRYFVAPTPDEGFDVVVHGVT